MKVEQIWRYPVKSMAGERLESAFLSRRGFAGDRGWAVWDEARGGVTNAKRLPALRALKPRYLTAPAPGAASPAIEITFPDGSRRASDDTHVSKALSDYLGRAVSLRALGPIGSEAAARLKLSDEPEDVVRELSGLEPGEPEADFSMLPAERLAALRKDNFFDAFPVHVLTRATLVSLRAIAPDSDWDERRFRMNLLVEDAKAGYPEQEWVGRRVRIGAAMILVDMGCPRCAVPTQPVDELPKDPRVMRVLVKETHHIAGIYAGVVEEGEIAIGDEVL